METYEARLATFTPASTSRKQRQPSWPHPTGFSVTPKTLAAAGFFYDPTDNANDNVTCAYCEKGLEGWENGDDALDEHLRRIDKETGETCPWATVMGAKRDWDLFGVEKAEDPESEAMAQTRKGTFGWWWKFDSKKGWKPTSDRLALAGFYNNPLQDAPDTCACVYCDVQLDGWSKNDDPETEHKQRSPDCFFFTARQQKSKKAPKNVLQESKKGATKQNARASVASAASSTATGASKGKAKTGALSRSTTAASMASSTIIDIDENENPSIIEIEAPPAAKKGGKASKAKSTTSGRSRASRAPSRMGESEAEVEAEVLEVQPAKASKTKAKTTRAGKKPVAAPSVMAISEDETEGDAAEVSVPPPKPAPKGGRRTTKVAKPVETQESDAESRAPSPPPAKPAAKKGTRKAVKAGKTNVETQDVQSESDANPSEAIPAVGRSQASEDGSRKKGKAAAQTAESSADEASVVLSKASGRVSKDAAQAKEKRDSQALSLELLKEVEGQVGPEETSLPMPAKTVPSRRAAKVSTSTATGDEVDEPSIVIKPPKKKATAKTGNMVRSNSGRTIVDSSDEGEVPNDDKPVAPTPSAAVEASQSEEVLEDAPTPKAKSTKGSASSKPARGTRTTRSNRSNSNSTKGDVSVSVVGTRTRSQSQGSVASAVSATSSWGAAANSTAASVDEEDVSVVTKSKAPSKGRKGAASKGKKTGKATGKGKQKEVVAGGDETFGHIEAESSVCEQTDVETELEMTTHEVEMEVLVSPPRAPVIEAQETVKKPMVVEVVIPTQALTRSVKALPKRKSSPRQLLQVDNIQQRQESGSPSILSQASSSTSQPISRSQSALDALLSGPMPNFDSPEKTLQLENLPMSPAPTQQPNPQDSLQLPLASLTKEEAALPVKEWVKLLAQQHINQFEADSTKLLQAWDRQVAAGRKELLKAVDMSS